jgi:hypothetical protein
MTDADLLDSAVVGRTVVAGLAALAGIDHLPEQQLPRDTLQLRVAEPPAEQGLGWFNESKTPGVAGLGNVQQF